MWKLPSRRIAFLSEGGRKLAKRKFRRQFPFETFHFSVPFSRKRKQLSLLPGPKKGGKVSGEKFFARLLVFNEASCENDRQNCKFLLLPFTSLGSRFIRRWHESAPNKNRLLLADSRKILRVAENWRTLPFLDVRFAEERRKTFDKDPSRRERTGKVDLAQ